jgi:hypothetical protein
MKPIEQAYKLGADQAYDDFMKEAQGNLGDPMFWQGGTPAEEGAEAAPPPSAEDAALALPPGIFQGLQMKVNPAGERSTTVKVTPEALGAPDALQGIFSAEPAAKVEMAMPQATGEGAGSGGPADMGIPQEAPVDGAGALPPGMPAEGLPPELAGKVAALAVKYATKMTRIETESNPDVSKLYPWKSKKTRAERNAAEALRLRL